MKKRVLVFILVVAIFTGFGIGMFIYKISNKKVIDNPEPIAKKEKIEDSCTAEYEYYKEIKETISKEEKISPNATIIKKTYYTDCGHTVNSESKIDEKYINLTQDEFKKYIDGWSIEEFSANKIVLYREEEGICDEHYIVREKDGYIAVYYLKGDKVEELKEITDISIEFLPLTDLAKLKGGIKMYGKESLNSFLEDFE